MKTVLVVFGTRPEAIKMCPLVNELRKNDSFRTIVCVTGQHKQMLQQVLDVFDICPEYDLKIMKEKQTLYDITINTLAGMRDVLQRERPDIVLVHGDTTTAFAAGLAAFYERIKVGHVESGLRTYNLAEPFPEEFNRQCIDIIADYYFAPTNISKQNLIAEGKAADKIYITGNTVIDALKTTVQKDYVNPILDWADGSRMILLTAHRRENLGEPLYNIFTGIKRVLEEVEDIKIVYPVHSNPIVRETAEKVFGTHERIKLIEPLDVIDFHNFINKSYLILTDSGGIQEEAPALGKPVLVLRNTTERPEGVEAGRLKLVGTDSDTIAKEFRKLLDDKEYYELMSKAVNPYGDGTACRKIVDILKR